MIHTPSPAVPVARPPARLLLATDLSGRCDRAQDRALALADEWDAQLTALTVIDADLLAANGWENEPPAEVFEQAKSRLRAALSSERQTAVLVRSGAVAQQVLDVAQNGMELVITGAARDQWLRSLVLGSVVDGLLRASTVPTLIVRNRVHGPYRRVLVGGDLSELSAHILSVAVRDFPHAEIDFFHAFHVPLVELTDVGREETLVQAHRTAEAEAQAFLEAQDLPKETQGRIRVVCERGSPLPVLSAHLEESAVDLVIVGNHARSFLFEVLIGSTPTQLLQHAACDLLVVPSPSKA